MIRTEMMEPSMPVMSEVIVRRYGETYLLEIKSVDGVYTSTAVMTKASLIKLAEDMLKVAKGGE